MNMRRILTLGATALFVSALAFGETYSGKLVDASCAQQQQDAACTPTASTSAFALQVSGKMLKLDADGNKKAAKALKQSNSGADRAKDPSASDSQVMASVEGTLNGDELQVDSIELQ
jgi:hypothetical protein